MIQAFIVAAVVTSPYGIRQFRRWRARRAAERAKQERSAQPETPRDPDGLEILVETVGEIALTTEPTTIRLPERPTHQRRAIDPVVARMILGDAARRSGVRIDWIDDRSALLTPSPSE